MSKTRKEILEYSHEDDVPILLWLFERYHMGSEWQFVAECTHQRYGKLSYQVHKIWRPKINGRAIYHYFNGGHKMADPTPLHRPRISEEQQELRDEIPTHLIEALDRYVFQGLSPGHFLTAVLSNDLMGAYGRADSTSKRYLEQLTRYIYNYVPLACHGSEEIVDKWPGLDQLMADRVE